MKDLSIMYKGVRNEMQKSRKLHMATPPERHKEKEKC